MKAFLIDRYGKHSGRIGELPAPDVGDHDVLVRVQAASVNLLDSKISKGEFKLILPYSFPLALGHDLAGVVVRVGSRVEQFKAGDEVYARAPDGHIGTFAEQISVNENALAVKPANISMEEAAALPLVALTAWQVLVETARLKKGQRSSSRPAQVASAPSPSSLPSTSAPSLRPLPAPPMWRGSKPWARTLSSITSNRISPTFCRTMTSC